MNPFLVKSFIPTQAFPAFPLPNQALRLALIFQLEQSQWWQGSEMKQVQYAQLKKVLEHAYATVPYYRDLWAQEKLVIPDKIDDTFFGRLPILRREDLQNAQDRFVTTQLPKEHGKIDFSTTSGSTGRPVRFARTAVTKQLWLAFALRENLWHKRDFSGKLCAIRWQKPDVGMPPEGIVGAHWGEVVNPIYATGPSCFLNVIAKLPEQYVWLRREKPDYLISFPSNLLALTDYIVSERLEFPKIKQLRMVGETLSASTREYLSRHWTTSIVDMYTCEEMGYLATQCPEASHFHVQSENVLLEIVDEQGRPCPVGVAGRVLVTSLNNFATPLIRYEIGDYAEFGPPCRCGRGLPVLQRVQGRKRNRLMIPTEEGVQSVFPYLGQHGQIAQATGVALRQFQCVQHTLEQVELRLAMERELTSEEQEKVVRLMQKNLGHPFTISCTFLQEIPRGPNGKFEEFISQVSL